MTVAEAIETLSKFTDKSLEVYFDCVHCGHPLVMVKADQCVIVRTEDPCVQREKP